LSVDESDNILYGLSPGNSPFSMISDGSTGYEVTVSHDTGETVVSVVPRGETLLEGCDAEISADCEWGACGTCVGFVREGDVEHRRTPRALTEEQVDDGYVLLCIAEPRSDCTVRIGRSVYEELLS
jgi:ferredoxin